MNYLIIVTDPLGNLASVKSEDIPAKISRYLESAIELALEVDSAVEDLRPAITIGGLTEEQSKRLDFLEALEAYGVDNWDGYSAAHSEVYPEEADDDTTEAV